VSRTCVNEPLVIYNGPAQVAVAAEAMSFGVPFPSDEAILLEIQPLFEKMTEHDGMSFYLCMFIYIGFCVCVRVLVYVVFPPTNSYFLHHTRISGCSRLHPTRFSSRARSQIEPFTRRFKMQEEFDQRASRIASGRDR
jgi:hypothetical protein